ncbi:MAG: hypothetical protein KF693_01965 [Nitrospira sp.]|nr:hypothetical protein [Nitrospira sp.]
MMNAYDRNKWPVLALRHFKKEWMSEEVERESFRAMAFARIQTLVNGFAQIGYHLAVLFLSAAIALSLPAIADRFLVYWARIDDDRTSLLMLEAIVASLLILFANVIRLSVRDKALAKMAIGAGLVSYYPSHEPSARRRIKQLKEKQGTGRTVMAIGSSGYGTLTDQVGDLASVLERCTGAKILLVNPYSPEARARICAIADPDYSVELFQEEVRRSIELLKRLRAMGKSVRLKFYSEPPLVKLVILGDYLWLQHYHPDLNVRTMPEYVFRHNPKDHGLYTFYYHYFVQRWSSCDVGDYDFDREELVYRDPHDRSDRRVPFGQESEAYPGTISGSLPAR